MESIDWTPLIFFFFNDTATTEIYTLSLHDALPICARAGDGHDQGGRPGPGAPRAFGAPDRKSTRLNSSHLVISYAVFCLKKKKKRLRPAVRSTQYTTRPPSRIAHRATNVRYTAMSC